MLNKWHEGPYAPYFCSYQLERRQPTLWYGDSFYTIKELRDKKEWADHEILHKLLDILEITFDNRISYYYRYPSNKTIFSEDIKNLEQEKEMIKSISDRMEEKFGLKISKNKKGKIILESIKKKREASIFTDAITPSEFPTTFKGSIT